MAARTTVQPEVIADVLVTSRRRCCVCFALSGNMEVKRGQVAHVDRNASNSARDNLVFLCFDHHDQYDSRTSQSKGLTVEELRQYQAQLGRFLAQALPLSDMDVARALLAGLDRPAFRTPFRHESSLPRFRAAIAETIAAISTGKTPTGTQLPSKAGIGDAAIRTALDDVVRRLVALRSAFDDLVKNGEIRPCGCHDPDCPIHMLSDAACHEMDRRRHELLLAARAVDPTFPESFYDMG